MTFIVNGVYNMPKVILFKNYCVLNGKKILSLLPGTASGSSLLPYLLKYKMSSFPPIGKGKKAPPPRLL